MFGTKLSGTKIFGLVWDLNPGPLAPKARIIPLDQQAAVVVESLHFLTGFFSNCFDYVAMET